MKPRFIFFTKTQWGETPRLRHQLARLLADAGNQVLFFEKPLYPWQNAASSVESDGRIALLQHRSLLHHKIRMSPAMHRANACVVKQSVRHSLRGYDINEHDVVVNFNFDYFFLREIFPKNRIITIINDDFLSIALFGFERPLRWAMQRTCAGSDRVLVVSLPLQRQLAEYCRPELFLPWADCAYRRPNGRSERSKLLFWGFLNKRLDFEVIHDFADQLAVVRPDIRLVFAGPIYPDHVEQAQALRSKKNIEVLPATELDALPVDQILAALIPYRAHDAEIDAITLSNKGLQLLARGLPLLISQLPALPNFLDAPFVVRLDTSDVGKLIDSLRSQFDDMQPAIEDFVSVNGPDARLRAFLSRSNPGVIIGDS